MTFAFDFETAGEFLEAVSRQLDHDDEEAEIAKLYERTEDITE